MDKYNNAGRWEASYTDTHGHLVTSNPVAQRFPYVPHYTEGLKLVDQQGNLIPGWGELAMVKNIEVKDFKGSVSTKDIVNWEAVDKETLLKLYFYEHYMRLKELHDYKKKHPKTSIAGNLPHVGNRGHSKDEIMVLVPLSYLQSLKGGHHKQKGGRKHRDKENHNKDDGRRDKEHTLRQIRDVVTGD
jgi:hypothetical protein